MPTRVAYQGEPGAYSEAAAHEAFQPTGEHIEAIGYESFDKVFEALAQGDHAIEEFLDGRELLLAANFGPHPALCCRPVLWDGGRRRARLGRHAGEGRSGHCERDQEDDAGDEGEQRRA